MSVIPVIQPDPRPLRKAPVGLVACQVNFSETDRRIVGKDVFKFQEALSRGGGDYSELTPFRKGQVTLQIGLLGATSSSDATSSSGWRFANHDQTWSVALFPDSVILESRAYAGWTESFKPRLEAAVTSVIEVFRPDIETRLGLRYINALSDEQAASATFWRSKVQGAFLGPLGHENVGDGFKGSALRANFAFDHVEANVSLAFQPDAVYQGNTAVVFDIDVFRHTPQEMNISKVLSGADILNTVALRIFQDIITPEYLEELR